MAEVEEVDNQTDKVIIDEVEVESDIIIELHDVDVVDSDIID